MKIAESSLNTVGKGEIARYEQFFLFPQCFQKACFPGASKGVIVWEWVKDIICMFLAPLAEGQRAIVVAWGRRACVRACVRPFVRACVRKLFL